MQEGVNPSLVDPERGRPAGCDGGTERPGTTTEI